jgi:hypothetical protein
MTMPAYVPQKASVAKRDRSRGGAHILQIPWQDGYVTPCVENGILMSIIQSKFYSLLNYH